MNNIVSNRYTFNSFVTALHESWQLENEISSSTTVGTRYARRNSDEDAHETLPAQYGRNPNFASKVRAKPRDVL